MEYFHFRVIVSSSNPVFQEKNNSFTITSVEPHWIWVDYFQLTRYQMAQKNITMILRNIECSSVMYANVFSPVYFHHMHKYAVDGS